MGSLATRFSETSKNDDDTADEGTGRGPQTASPQGSGYPRPLDPRPLPAWTGGRGGTSPRGRRFQPPSQGRDRGLDSLHTPPGPPGGDPGASGAEPTLTHTPGGPSRPPLRPAPSLTVSPGSGQGVLGENGELTLGLRPAEGAAHGPRPSQRFDTDTMSHKGRKCVSISPSGTALHFRVLSRSAGGFCFSVPKSQDPPPCPL